MTIALDAFPFHLVDPSIDRPSIHGFNEPWRAAQVESKFSQTASKVPQRESHRDSLESGRPAGARQAAADDVRPVVEKWVAVELPRHGHRRGAAYEAVARLFACHESWIRRLLGRQVRSFDADLYKRIMSSEAEADRRLIARHEAELRRLARPLDAEARDAAR